MILLVRRMQLFPLMYTFTTKLLKSNFTMSCTLYSFKYKPVPHPTRCFQLCCKKLCWQHCVTITFIQLLITKRNTYFFHQHSSCSYLVSWHSRQGMLNRNVLDSLRWRTNMLHLVTKMNICCACNLKYYYFSKCPYSSSF